MLAYHGVDDPIRFEQHLDYLADSMHPVTLDEALDAVAGRACLPKRAVLITFDDGDRSVFDVAMPMMQSRGIPGVAFVVAGLVDTNQPPWWIEVQSLAKNGGTTDILIGLSPADAVRALKKVSDQKRIEAIRQLRETADEAAPDVRQLSSEELRALESEGIAIGNHTMTHPCLNRCEDEKIVGEISQAHDVLTTAMGRAPRAFAYPNGDVDDRAINALSSLGYEAAFLFDHRVSEAPPADRFRISRARVNSHSNLDRFRIIVSGLHPAIHRARGGM